MHDHPAHADSFSLAAPREHLVPGAPPPKAGHRTGDVPPARLGPLPSDSPIVGSPVVPTRVLRGRVEAGDHRGRTLGVPTANIELDDDCDAADGVYAGLYRRPDGSTWPTAVSVGRRPTFYAESGRHLLEAHLVGFSGSLVGEDAMVELRWYLRPQRVFATSAELVTQLHRDIAAVRSLVASATVPGDDTIR
jgi:riboflavin kinase/FMN adenylyltransferase